uniref:hypothetical protein n=1 Tax=Polynucleobacter sp. TaxID=2029855 RepID=UPI0040472C7F
MSRFILQHWRGEFSLPLAYWGISFLLVSLIKVIGGYLVLEVESVTTSLTATAWILYMFYAFSLLLLTWSFVGTWRSATRYSSEKNSTIWSGLAKFAICLGILQISATFLTQEAKVLKVFAPYLIGADEGKRIAVEILDDGKTMKLTGAFGNGSYNAFKKSLDKNPNINKISLQSGGGLFKEVSLIAEEILLKRIDTYVEDKCESFCTIVFLSGYNRFSTPAAKIGFHAPTLTGASHLDDEFNLSSRKLYAKLRVSKEFIDKIYSTPNSDMWYPTHTELLDAGIVNKVTLGGETNSIAGMFNKSREELYQDFLKDSFSGAYERKFPGFLNKVLDIAIPMAKARKTDSEILNAIRAYAGTFQTKAIAMSTPELRARFITMAVNQAREASRLGGEACYKLITLTLDITKVFSKELVAEEFNLTKEALNSSYIPAKGYSMQLYASLAARATASLTEAEIAAISSPNPNRTDYSCSAITKFYESIEKLGKDSKDVIAYGMLAN